MCAVSEWVVCHLSTDTVQPSSHITGVETPPLLQGECHEHVLASLSSFTDFPLVFSLQLHCRSDSLAHRHCPSNCRVPWLLSFLEVFFSLQYYLLDINWLLYLRPLRMISLLSPFFILQVPIDKREYIALERGAVLMVTADHSHLLVGPCLCRTCTLSCSLFLPAVPGD